MSERQERRAGMIQRKIVGAALSLALLCPVTAWAEQVYSGRNRPTGFAIDVDLAVSTGSSVWLYEDVLIPSSALTPQLAVGAQINRFFVGLEVGISFSGTRVEEFDEFVGKLWIVELGPCFDVEIWSTQRAALFIGGGLGVMLYRTDDEDFAANGFNFDFSFGGRVYLVPQLSMGLKIGTGVGALFYDWDGDEDNARTIAWSFYGALAFRFVAAR
jgi:hypothetical protein